MRQCVKSYLFILLAIAGLISVTGPAFATINDPAHCDGSKNDPDTCFGSGPGSSSVCAGALFGGPLGCTANDVGIAKAFDISATECVKDQPIDFNAKFEVLTQGGVTRYDIGLYFALGGQGSDATAQTGECSVSIITPTNSTTDPIPGTTLSGKGFVNLDNAGNADPNGDLCGDINSAFKPQVVAVSLEGVTCTESDLFFNPATGECQATAPSGVTNPQKCMALPNAVSWRQTGANGLCNSPLDAFPGTTSKCKVDTTFAIPIRVLAEAAGQKCAETTPVCSVVRYGVEITNSASSPENLILDNICDDKFGPLAGTGCPTGTYKTVKSTTCLAGADIPPGEAYRCHFEAELCQTDLSHTNTITAKLHGKVHTGDVVNWPTAAAANNQVTINSLGSIGTSRTCPTTFDDGVGP
jgi:hypothetical protein